MTPSEELIEQITAAFTSVPKPPSWCLTNSSEGVEPKVLEEEFASLPAWDALTVDFLDSSPDGFGTALSFFSDEAYRYYLPAYLIASVREELQRVDPVFYLTHGLDNKTADSYQNPLRYGVRSWHDYSIYRHSMFDSAQVSAITAYLEWALTEENRSQAEQRGITEALNNFWIKRAE